MDLQSRPCPSLPGVVDLDWSPLATMLAIVRELRGLTRKQLGAMTGIGHEVVARDEQLRLRSLRTVDGNFAVRLVRYAGALECKVDDILHSQARTLDIANARESLGFDAFGKWSIGVCIRESRLVVAVGLPEQRFYTVGRDIRIARKERTLGTVVAATVFQVCIDLEVRNVVVEANKNHLLVLKELAPKSGVNIHEITKDQMQWRFSRLEPGQQALLDSILETYPSLRPQVSFVDGHVVQSQHERNAVLIAAALIGTYKLNR